MPFSRGHSTPEQRGYDPDPRIATTMLSSPTAAGLLEMNFQVAKERVKAETGECQAHNPDKTTESNPAA